LDIGTSVSRVGGKTQAPALREAAESLRLDYAQFLELEIFTRFGGMPDARIKSQLARGASIRTILNQNRHAPLPLAEQVALVMAVQSGFLDVLSPQAWYKFSTELRVVLARDAAPALQMIAQTGRLGDAEKQELRAALQALARESAKALPP
jgi:F-type H+-transporting ATPase subunit alpha